MMELPLISIPSFFPPFSKDWVWSYHYMKSGLRNIPFLPPLTSPPPPPEKKGIIVYDIQIPA